ncbi:hypothetical protein D3C80_1415750 [compost metagenome]
MADVDGGQLFAGGLDLFHQFFCVVALELGVNQRHFVFTADDLRGHREHAFLTWVVHFHGQSVGGGGVGAKGGDAGEGQGQ